MYLATFLGGDSLSCLAFMIWPVKKAIKTIPYKSNRNIASTLNEKFYVFSLKKKSQKIKAFNNLYTNKYNKKQTFVIMIKIVFKNEYKQNEIT